MNIMIEKVKEKLPLVVIFHIGWWKNNINHTLMYTRILKGDQWNIIDANGAHKRNDQPEWEEEHNLIQLGKAMKSQT